MDPDRDDLTYDVYGLPAESGLRVDRKKGLLYGVPKEFAAVVQQPLTLGLLAEDALKSRSGTLLRLMVKLDRPITPKNKLLTGDESKFLHEDSLQKSTLQRRVSARLGQWLFMESHRYFLGESL